LTGTPDPSISIYKPFRFGVNDDLSNVKSPCSFPSKAQVTNFTIESGKINFQRINNDSTFFVLFQCFDDRKHPLWKLHGEVYRENNKKDRSDLEKLENEWVTNTKQIGFGDAATLEMDVYSKML